MSAGTDNFAINNSLARHSSFSSVFTLTTMTLELCDTYSHLKRFEEIIAPYNVIELVRTGTIAISKGADTITAKK